MSHCKRPGPKSFHRLIGSTYAASPSNAISPDASWLLSNSISLLTCMLCSAYGPPAGVCCVGVAGRGGHIHRKRAMLTFLTKRRVELRCRAPRAFAVCPSSSLIITINAVVARPSAIQDIGNLHCANERFLLILGCEFLAGGAQPLAEHGKVWRRRGSCAIVSSVDGSVHRGERYLSYTGSSSPREPAQALKGEIERSLSREHALESHNTFRIPLQHSSSVSVRLLADYHPMAGTRCRNEYLSGCLRCRGRGSACITARRNAARTLTMSRARKKDS